MLSKSEWDVAPIWVKFAMALIPVVGIGFGVTLWELTIKLAAY